jgi:hypothetical protein
MYKPVKLTTLNRCKLTTKSGGEKVSFMAADYRSVALILTQSNLSNFVLENVQAS